MKRAGLTLLELVVVLAILAILATVAVVSMENTIDHARYDVTRKTLDEVDVAVLGPPSGTSSDEYRGFQGFAADVGRTPLANGNVTDDGSQLSELWSNVRNLRLYGPATTSDTNIVVYSGWRGPYIRRQDTTRPVLDGWGNPFRALNATNDATLVDGDAIVKVGTQGGSSPPYITPMVNQRSFAGQTGSITGSIIDADSLTPSTTSVEVRLFVPNGTIPGGVNEYVRTFNLSGTDTSNEAGTAHTGFEFVFPDPVHYPTTEGTLQLTAGPKVLRITQGSTIRQVIHFWLPSSGYQRTERIDLK